MPMGNPLSPTIADIVLDNLLDDALMELNNKNIKIKYISKYVDDIFAVINSDDKDEILKTLNSHHPKLKFTMEMEIDGKIAYLDTRLQRDSGKIIFDWYSKETASGRLMNYNANQPKNQILNTAQNLIERVLKISDERFHKTNIRKLYEILINNSFPKNTIKTLIEATKHRLKQNQQLGNTEQRTDRIFYSVKYIPGLTDNRNIRNTINNNNKICFAYKPSHTLNSLFTNTKAPIEKQQQSNVVYKIPCKGNDNERCNLVYIGTTKRTLSTRISEHKMNINKRKESTALSQHMIKTGHIADFDQIKILDKEKVAKKRYTKESLHIQRNIAITMNLKEDTDNINASYRVAIK